MSMSFLYPHEILKYAMGNQLQFISKCHNHRPQTSPRYLEEETQNTDSHNINKVKQSALSVTVHITAALQVAR